MTSPDSPAVDVVSMPSAAGAPTVVGLDLSLTSTGLAVVNVADDALSWLAKHETKLRGLDRLRSIIDWIVNEIETSSPDLVCIEGPSYGSQGAMQHERGGLWWMVYAELDSRDYTLVSIPPASVKLYATGKGNAKKDVVLAAACRRFPAWPVQGNDEADALWLAAMGADHLGSPHVAMPAANRTALDKVQWPTAVAA